MKTLCVASLFALGLLAAGCSDVQQPSSTSPSPSTWSSPPVTLTEARASTLNQAVNELKGKVVVVDFWATWCSPCVKKFPHLVDLQKRFADQGLACVSVSLDKQGSAPLDFEKVKGFLVRQDARFANFVMTDFQADHAELHKRFGLGNGIPFLVVLDRDGQPVWNSEDNVKERASESQELDAIVEKLLAQKK